GVKLKRLKEVLLDVRAKRGLPCVDRDGGVRGDAVAVRILDECQGDQHRECKRAVNRSHGCSHIATIFHNPLVSCMKVMRYVATVPCWFRVVTNSAMPPVTE